MSALGQDPISRGGFQPRRIDDVTSLEIGLAPERLAGMVVASLSAMEASMNQVEVEQKNYQMPPQDGFTVAFFLTVAEVERSVRFYETVFGGRILSRGDSNGLPGYIQIANTWLIVNVGGGPTPEKPSVTLTVPRLSVRFPSLMPVLAPWDYPEGVTCRLQ